MPRPTLLRLLVGCSALLLALGFTGCTHYQLGSGGKLSFSRLYVAPVRDGAGLPQAAVLVTSQLRERILRDARVQLVDSPDAAEAILEVTLTRYERGVATVRPNDTGLARKLELALEAEATLRNTANNVDWFSRRPLIVRRQAFTDMPEASETFGNQGQAERQTFVLVATAVAEAAASAALDVW